MEGAVEHTLHEFGTLHTGKANPSMIENLQVKVESYGATMHLKELAAITTPDPSTIQVQPWDKGVVADVEKAILTANLGFNPVVAGTVIRVPVPELSTERRRELVRMAHSIAEASRMSIRHARRQAMFSLKELQKDGQISEDDQRRHEKEIQTETDKHIASIGQHVAKKEQELMTV
jgi:ribosome recycling factor